ncbi:hypothetical protein Tco_1568429 [Tanacetum coccineum]
MEECHKMRTNQVDWTNPKGDQVRFDVKRPPPLDGLPGHENIQTHFFFNKDLGYLRYGSKGRSPALSISNMKAARYPDFGFELLVLLDYLLGSRQNAMLSTAVKLWTRNLVIRQRVEDFQLGIKSYKMQLNLTKAGCDATSYEFKHDYTIIESPRAVVFSVNNNERKIMQFNDIYKFSDGKLTRILEALDYRSKNLRTSGSIQWVFNSLVHSLRALSTLRRSGLRTASTAANPCQGDSL